MANAERDLNDCLLRFQASRQLDAFGVSCGRLNDPRPIFLAADCGTNTSCTNKGAAKTLFFDLASLTKALVTAPLVWRALDSMAKTGRGPYPTSHNFSSLEELLTHRSGFPAWQNFYVNTKRLPEADFSLRRITIMKRLKESAYRLKGKQPLGLYSDINFILLGIWLETLYGKTLSQILVETQRSQLNHVYLRYFTSKESSERFFSSGFCPLRGREIRGFVHDENAYALGQSTGHAGVYGSITQTDQYLRNFLRLYPGFFLENQNRTKKQEPLIGWQYGGESAEDFFPGKKVVGHLGFTGTAFWVDPQSQSYAIFLSNRLSLGERLRPDFKNVRREIFLHLGRVCRGG